MSKLRLADFLRDIQAGNMYLELVERYGSREIKDNLRGKRKIIKGSSRNIVLQDIRGNTSTLEIKSAKLIEYTGDKLVVYDPGLRELTEEERGVIIKADELRRTYQEKNPYANSFWAMKRFFKDSKCPWMEGNHIINNKMYIRGVNKVMDAHVRGKVILIYNVFRG